MPLEAFAARDYFYVGGQYVMDGETGRHYLIGQMYVEHLVPSAAVQQPYPLVLIHGGGQTGTVRAASLRNKQLAKLMGLPELAEQTRRRTWVGDFFPA